MPKLSVQARTLQRDAELLGGDRALARYLHVSLPNLFAWMRPGAEPPPNQVFLRAVDLVLEDCGDDDMVRPQRVRVVAIHKEWTKEGGRK
jgi:hypothetical protein